MLLVSVLKRVNCECSAPLGRVALALLDTSKGCAEHQNGRVGTVLLVVHPYQPASTAARSTRAMDSGPSDCLSLTVVAGAHSAWKLAGTC